jgi:hypothetical protein
MATLKVDIDVEMLERLVERAVRERRPIDMQAAVMLRQALGLPFPYASHVADKCDEAAEGRGDHER